MECLDSGVVTYVFKDHPPPPPQTVKGQGWRPRDQLGEWGILIAVTANSRYTRITEQEWKQLGERVVNVLGG